MDFEKYNLTITSPLLSRDAFLKTKHSMWQQSRVLSTFNKGTVITVRARMMGVFINEEGDVIIIS